MPLYTVIRELESTQSSGIMVRYLTKTTDKQNPSKMYHAKLNVLSSSQFKSKRDRRIMFEIIAQRWLRDYCSPQRCMYLSIPTQASIVQWNNLISTRQSNTDVQLGMSKPIQHRLKKFVRSQYSTHKDISSAWIAITITPYIQSITILELTPKEYTQYIFQCIYGIYYMAHILRINHNDLHPHNIMIRRNPHMYTCNIGEYKYRIPFDIQISIIDFDRCTIEGVPNFASEFDDLSTFDPSGRSDLLRFLCSIMYVQPKYNDLITDLMFTNKDVRTTRSVLKSIHKGNCYFQYGRYQYHHNTRLRSPKWLDCVYNPQIILERMLKNNLS